MRGVVLGVFGGMGLMLFSFVMLTSETITFFWLFLELATLSVVPMFFMRSDLGVLGGLFKYLMASSVSSSFLLCGVLCKDLDFVMMIGFVLKFGLFPLWGWIYKVGLKSNWAVLWSISTFLKSPVFLLLFFCAYGCYTLVHCLCCISLLLLSVFFWFYTYSWVYCWCHMMLSSSAALVAMSFSVASDTLVTIFFMYCAWASMVILFFYSCGDGGVPGVMYYFWFCFLLVSMPVSMSMFYKLVMVSGIYSCWFPVLVCWVIYSISEQFYLLKYIMSYDLPKGGFGALRVV